MRDDAIADGDAFITNKCRRAGNEPSHRALRIVAERATKLPLAEELQEGESLIHPHGTVTAEGATIASRRNSATTSTKNSKRRMGRVTTKQ